MAEDALVAAGPFADLLRARRQRFNALFEAARRAKPALDADVVLEHVRDMLGPVTLAVCEVSSDRAGDAVDVVYGIMLRLFSAGLLGTGEKAPLLRDGLTRLLVAGARHVAAAPLRVTRSFANAIVNLAGTPGVSAPAWIQEMEVCARECEHTDLLLQLGQVLAWRHGVAHFRQGSLELCRSLQPQDALRALGCSGCDPAGLGRAIDRLEEDPWLDPVAAFTPLPTRRALGIVKRVGGFTGFGGCFLQPPEVATSDGLFLARAGGQTWRITADRFGDTLHACDERFKRGAPAPFRIDRRGCVELDDESRVFPELEGMTSAVSSGATLAVTTEWSHKVYLVARVC